MKNFSRLLFLALLILCLGLAIAAVISMNKVGASSSDGPGYSLEVIVLLALSVIFGALVYFLRPVNKN